MEGSSFVSFPGGQGEIQVTKTVSVEWMHRMTRRFSPDNIDEGAVTSGRWTPRAVEPGTVMFTVVHFILPFLSRCHIQFRLVMRCGSQWRSS